MRPQKGKGLGKMLSNMGRSEEIVRTPVRNNTPLPLEPSLPPELPVFEEPITGEEAIAQIVQTLTAADLEMMELLSFVDPSEPESLATMLSVADRYNLKWLKSNILHMLRLRVSVARLGRDDVVKIATSSPQTDIGAGKLSGVRNWFSQPISGSGPTPPVQKVKKKKKRKKVEVVSEE